MSGSVISSIALIVASIALYQAANKNEVVPPEVDLVAEQPAFPRYQLIMHPTYLRHTFLLDTQTGNLWSPTEHTYLKGNPTIWTKQDIADSSYEKGLPLSKYVEIYGEKNGK